MLPVRLAVLGGIRQVGEEPSLQVGFNAIAMATGLAPQQLSDYRAPQYPLVVPRQETAQQWAYFCQGAINKNHQQPGPQQPCLGRESPGRCFVLFIYSSFIHHRFTKSYPKHSGIRLRGRSLNKLNPNTRVTGPPFLKACSVDFYFKKHGHIQPVTRLTSLSLSFLKSHLAIYTSHKLRIAFH